MRDVTPSFTIGAQPTALFGVGAIGNLPRIVRGIGADAGVVLVTDAALATTSVVASVTAVLKDAGLAVLVFSGVHPNPTTDDLAAGAGDIVLSSPCRKQKKQDAGAAHRDRLRLDPEIRRQFAGQRGGQYLRGRHRPFGAL